jgi:hypothetical protein
MGRRLRVNAEGLLHDFIEVESASAAPAADPPAPPPMEHALRPVHLARGRSAPDARASQNPAVPLANPQGLLAAG